jgi:hypothetical protein
MSRDGLKFQSGEPDRTESMLGLKGNLDNYFKMGKRGNGGNP